LTSVRPHLKKLHGQLALNEITIKDRFVELKRLYVRADTHSARAGGNA
jgi:hypothetical protein